MSPASPPQTRRWERYVAIGDSFTEGMSDPDPLLPDTFIGWADRLAAHLAAHARVEGGGFGYANLAVRGRLLDDVVGAQLTEALALGPDLVSMVGGGNDILRPKADLDSLADRLERAVVTIRATGADVLLATPVDPREAPLVRHTRGRAGIHSANIFSIARRHDCFVIDQWSLTALRDWRLWAPDRIHMTAEGHRRVALEALHALGLKALTATDATDGTAAATDETADATDETADATTTGTLGAHPGPPWRVPLPPAPAVTRRTAARANAQWAREYVAPWVQRRLQGRSSGDSLTAKRPMLGPVEDPRT